MTEGYVRAREDMCASETGLSSEELMQREANLSLTFLAVCCELNAAPDRSEAEKHNFNACFSPTFPETKSFEQTSNNQAVTSCASSIKSVS